MDLQYIDIDLLKPENRNATKGITVSELDRYIVRHKGLHQPVLAYLNPHAQAHERYLIFAGLKTWLIAQEVEFQFEKIPVIIYDKPDQSVSLSSGIESLFQYDQKLDVIDEAKLLQSVLDEKGSLSIAELARQLGRKRSDLSNQLRLLKLPIEIRNWIKQGKLRVGAGRALITEKNERTQIALAKEVMQKNLSMRVLEQRIRGKNSSALVKNKPVSIEASSDPNTRFLEQTLSQQLGSTVRLSDGKLVIDYYDDLEVLQGLLQQLGLVREADEYSD